MKKEKIQNNICCEVVVPPIDTISEKDKKERIIKDITCTIYYNGAEKMNLIENEYKKRMTLKDKIIQWGKEKGLHNTDDSTKQLLYAMSEVGELAQSMAKEETDKIHDAIGDIGVCLINAMTIDNIQDVQLSKHIDINRALEIKPGITYYCNLSQIILQIMRQNKKITYDYQVAFVVLNQIAILYNSTFMQCLQIAYNEIKNRKGKNINGVFVKE